MAAAAVASILKYIVDRHLGPMTTPATRDIEIEIMASLQELLAQQAVALKVMGRIHTLVDGWIAKRTLDLQAEAAEAVRGRSRSRSPPRASAASVRDRESFQRRGRAMMSNTVVLDEMPVAEAPTIPGITMAPAVLPEQGIVTETVDPTLIRN